MVETKKSKRRTSQGTASAAQALVVSGLPTCTIKAADNGTWHMTAQLASDDQAAFAACAPSPDDLCRRAQHIAIDLIRDECIVDQLELSCFEFVELSP